MHGQNIIQDLETYWTTKCTSGTIPLRSIIDPLEIPYLLPYVFLTEITDSPRDFYCILAGEHIIKIGRNVIGMYMSQLAQEMSPFQNVFNDCDYAATHKKPIQNQVNFLSPQGIYKNSIYILLPLGTNDNTTSSMLLGAVVFQQNRGHLDYSTSFKR